MFLLLASKYLGIGSITSRDALCDLRHGQHGEGRVRYAPGDGKHPERQNDATNGVADLLQGTVKAGRQYVVKNPGEVLCPASDPTTRLARSRTSQNDTPCNLIGRSSQLITWVNTIWAQVWLEEPNSSICTKQGISL